MEQSILIERALFQGSLLAQDVPGSRKNFNALRVNITGLTETIAKGIVNVEEFVDESIDALHTEQAMMKFQQVLATLKTVECHYGDFVIQADATINMVGTRELVDIAESSAEMAALEDALRHELVDLLTDIQAFTLEASLQAEQDERTGIFWIAVSLAIALLVGAVLPFVISRSITNPIKYLSSRLAEIAGGDGDLTVSLNDTARDETGDVARAFNQFLSVLRELITSTNVQATALGESSQVAMRAMQDTV